MTRNKAMLRESTPRQDSVYTGGRVDPEYSILA